MIVVVLRINAGISSFRRSVSHPKNLIPSVNLSLSNMRNLDLNRVNPIKDAVSFT